MSDVPKRPQNSVRVIIAGEIVTLSGEENPEYIQKVAAYVDKKIAELSKVRKVIGVNSFLNSLLIATNISDDLFKALDALDVSEADNEALKARLKETEFQLATALNGNKILQENLAKTQEELAEYVEILENFDNEKQTKNQIIQLQK